MTKKITKTTTVTTTTEEMVTNEKTHIICILDRSGSMSDIMSDSIGGFNTFLNQQKELPDEATITVILFDDKYELVYDNVNIKKANELTSKVWYARGTTSLYDTIGKTINTEKSKFEFNSKEKPEKVLVCIVTDGEENSSREYTCDMVKNLIKECENDNWNFIFLAANQNAFKTGGNFGMTYGNTVNYVTTSIGISNMSKTLSDATTNYRSMTTTNDNFNTLSKSLITDNNISVTTDSLTISNDLNGKITVSE